jgi:predicted dithiol-disulfide oxidoreductase (DUF899 family)
MTEHRIATQEEWQTARDELVTRENEHTRRGDAPAPSTSSSTAALSS